MFAAKESRGYLSARSSTLAMRKSRSSKRRSVSNNSRASPLCGHSLSPTKEPDFCRQRLVGICGVEQFAANANEALPTRSSSIALQGQVLLLARGDARKKFLQYEPYAVILGSNLFVDEGGMLRRGSSGLYRLQPMLVCCVRATIKSIGGPPKCHYNGPQVG